MKTTRLSPRQAMILAVSVLMLASLACSPIVHLTPATEPTQPPPPTAVVAGGTSDSPPPEPTATVPPTVSTPGESPPHAGSWQPISDLPRHINTLVADPTAPQVLYAGTGFTGSGSGVYKSEDAGLTWRLVSAGLPSEDVAALAFSHDDPPTLYAAVGSDIFASADHGASWSQQAQGVGNYRGFGRMRVAPGDGRVLYGVTVIEGAFRSDDGGHNWLPASDGLPKDSNGSLNAQSLAIDPTDADVVYLGTGWGPFHGNGVYKSTDGGETWAPANRGMIDYSITALAVNPADPQVVYAGGNDGDLFKSTDGGQAWGDPTAKSPDRTSIIEIALDPAAPEVIYLLCEQTGVLVSSDGGEKWRLLGKPGEPDYPTFTAMAIVFDPQPVLVIGIRDGGGWRYAAD